MTGQKRGFARVKTTASNYFSFACLIVIVAFGALGEIRKRFNS
jgi:hypothetical protein